VRATDWLQISAFSEENRKVTKQNQEEMWRIYMLNVRK
jgi:hypothetical protein